MEPLIHQVLKRKNKTWIKAMTQTCAWERIPGGTCPAVPPTDAGQSWDAVNHEHDRHVLSCGLLERTHQKQIPWPGKRQKPLSGALCGIQDHLEGCSSDRSEGAFVRKSSYRDCCGSLVYFSPHQVIQKLIW